MLATRLLAPLAAAVFIAQALGCAPSFAASSDDALVARGEYVARLGDCGACHTAKSGKFMAGGLAFETPGGTVFSTNITPDPKTGIGSYTLEQFDRAVRRGVAADGHHLYPAMPYPSFAKTTDEDIKALYAYFMKGVTPVEQANKPDEMHFPFNIRASMYFWNLLFLDKKPFTPDPAKDAQWNRGAYIVEGLGHCGTCHTPRGLAMQEKAYGDDSPSYLAGSTLSPWRAISLRNLTSEDDIVELLKTGANKHSMAFGPMTEVIHHSTQYFTDDDLRAMAKYLVSLAPAGAKPPETAAVDEKELWGTRGGLGYVQFCSSCHHAGGLGAPRIFPALAGNPAFLSDDPTSVLNIVLAGGGSAETKARDHVFHMPAFAPLGDEELAEILTFARKSWGNSASAVTAAQVAAMRKKLALPPPAPKSNETPRFADLLGEPDSGKLVFGAQLMMDTVKLLPKNVGNAMNCASCHINGGTVAKASPFFGVVSLFPMMNKRAGKIITIEDRLNGCFQRSEAGSPLAVDSKEMQAMVAFMAWMKGDKGPDGKIVGRGTGKVPRTLKPDPVHGEKLYKAECAVCHGKDGEGAKNAAGDWLFPPLWGDKSYNIGAGIARTYTAANFIKANMPIAHVKNFPQDQGGLSDQDAVDIAEFFSHQPRPDFPPKVNDWPNGGKPSDARY
ncbi:c-type cytochrome [Rhodoblastus acidophilus]|uniref:C-type cytochrome n=1 Tax=Candidatus Rhodoblastus alkanivorans TaxID=2954117 RepID=A0ABS9ZAE8_9HYPH|nr:c-type cytochrome [Candidatus Rhodoblastus alkanivorans]MCI4680699.1 c-type cytochrome [Candidatus Rhodoblastus alkanivorans]MCI4684031.1 c-type cytochrome [Candidatus Rhodoblastus alkanivorans]MDI4641350.1 c-type cytochrome [Rhodoblastus acidophilus]